MTKHESAPPRGQAELGFIDRIAAAGPVFLVYLMAEGAMADNTAIELVGRGGQQDDGYSPASFLGDRGAEVVFVAEVERQLIGRSPAWDRVAVVKYPTGAALLEMQRRRASEERTDRGAGRGRTIVMACTPLALPEFSPVELGDDAFVMLHVLKFADGGVSRMAEYGATAGAEGLRLGVRPQAFLAVEGTVAGDGRSWDQVRFNQFPSHAVFEQLRANATHQDGQPTRQAALDDTYALMLRPSINTLSAAVRS